ncbi:hypothetical protein THAOC_17602 [Thalassiosira oceanica]|uniref:Uncharacterized protein n=1 Tax=Thalassiosira oceanica TaxID=159749 RepID=K0S967_THAOC|nr:hypothetical protein THAOC_17602 [Thalassiosira oceanica]|eukprot:EJK61835.1 hypothetical protein THAOC_17602 [Thalassiosira oceanica]
MSTAFAGGRLQRESDMPTAFRGRRPAPPSFSPGSEEQERASGLCTAGQLHSAACRVLLSQTSRGTHQGGSHLQHHTVRERSSGLKSRYKLSSSLPSPSPSPPLRTLTLCHEFTNSEGGCHSNELYNSDIIEGSHISSSAQSGSFDPQQTIQLAAEWLDVSQEEHNQKGLECSGSPGQLSSSGIESSAKRVAFEGFAKSRDSSTEKLGARSLFSPIPQRETRPGGEPQSISRTVLRHLKAPSGKTSAWSSTQLRPLAQFTFSHSFTLVCAGKVDTPDPLLSSVNIDVTERSR